MDDNKILFQNFDHQIEYVGVHYNEAQNYPSQILKEKEFESCWQKFANKVKEIN